jgi:WD40 repeat protein
MSASTLARSLPTSSARLWRALRWRTRAALALLAVALPVLSWFLLRERPDEWPARMVIYVPERNWPLALSPDGRTLLSTGKAGIIPWDTRTGRSGTPWATKKGSFFDKGIYSPDGRTFAAVIFYPGQSVAIELFDPSNGRSKATLATRHPLVYDMAFADGGRTLRAILGDSRAPKEATTWDVATGQQTSSRPITAPIRASSTAFSPDGRLLAFIPSGATAVQLWDLESDRMLGSLTNPARTGNLISHGIDFSPDGRTLAVARSDGAIDLWDVPGRKLLKTLPAHPRGYDSMAIRFAPDGRTLASIGRDVASTSTVQQVYHVVKHKFFGSPQSAVADTIVVDLATGRRVGRTSSSNHPMYTPDGRTLVTRSEDLSVKLRDLPELPK